MAFCRPLLRASYQRERRPLFLEFRSSKGFITSIVALAVFTDIFLYGVIIPVAPFALERRVGIPHEKTQYWVSILLAVFGAAVLVASPPWGYLADRISSRRLPYLGGLIVLAVATALLAVGTSLPLWIAGRTLQGFSSAIVWISGPALLVDTVGSKDVGQAMGYVGASLSLALFLAPMLGGVVFDRAGYQSVFAMCWALLGADIALRICMIEKKAALKWLVPPVDDVNAEDKEQSANTSITDEEKASTTASAHTPPEPLKDTIPTHHSDAVIGPTPSTQPPPASATILPTPRAHRAKFSQISVVILLSSPRFLASLYGALIQASLLTAMDSTLPLQVRDLFGWSSLGAGLILLPLSLPSFFGPLVGYWVDRRGPRIPAFLSFALATPFIILLRIIDRDTLAQKVGLCGLLLGLGIAVSLALPPIMAEMSFVVFQIEKERPGVFGPRGAFAQAYGLFNLAFAGGMVLGPIWGGLITSHAGYGTMTWTLGLLSAFTAIPIGLFVGGPLWKRQTAEDEEERRG